jgi:hypothetical protein
MSSYVFKNLDKEWDFDTLSGNPIISMEDVENHPEIDWNHYYRSKKPYKSLQNLIRF